VSDVADLYKDVIKHLRVVRNVSRSHKDATQNEFVDCNQVTPYERGRLTRSCTRLGQTLKDLCLLHKQEKMVFYFVAYVDALKVGPGEYSKPGANYWFDLRQNAMDLLSKQPSLMEGIPGLLEQIGTMIDEPLSKAPKRAMFLRLAIP
jgi:hypothetical protein